MVADGVEVSGNGMQEEERNGKQVYVAYSLNKQVVRQMIVKKLSKDVNFQKTGISF